MLAWGPALRVSTSRPASVLHLTRKHIQHGLLSQWYLKGQNFLQGIRVTHSEFRYLDGRPGTRANEAYTSLMSGSAGQDCNGHGTHVAGAVGGLTYGVAKNVTLHAVRSLECLGNGTVSQVSLRMQPGCSGNSGEGAGQQNQPICGKASVPHIFKTGLVPPTGHPLKLCMHNRPSRLT